MTQAQVALQDVLRKLTEATDKQRPLPAATPALPRRRLCVAMSTFDDFDGVYFTVQALRMYHPEVADQLSVLIIDNHPEGVYSGALRDLVVHIGTERAQYLPFNGYRGTAVRDLAFRHANAEIVVCVDSHVLVAPGGLAAIIEYYDQNPESRDLLQGPLVDDVLAGVVGTHLAPTWGAGMYGQWAVDDAVHDGAPFDIPMQGLGLFACRAETWPGFNSRMRGFGAEEGYIHEKVRQRGGRTLCHPQLRWAHRFARPSGIPYSPILEDRVRNYFAAWDEIGWDRQPIIDHFREEYASVDHLDMVFEQTARQLASPFAMFDAIFSLNLDSATERWVDATLRYRKLDVHWRVERVSAVATPDNHHRGCALSWRQMIATAQQRGYRHFLGVEDDAVFADDIMAVLSTATAELAAAEAAGLEWDVLFLGGVEHDGGNQLIDGCTVLRRAGKVSCTHAVAVHERAFERLLAAIPPEGPEFDEWLGVNVAIDQYLAQRCSDGTYRALIVSPRVASQPALLNYANADLARAERFTI